MTANAPVKLLALTFDDGPNENSADLMDILSEYGVVATFFNVGRNITGCKDGDKLMLRAAELGIEIGNHSEHHVKTTELPDSEMIAEQTDTSAKIEAILGTPPRFFRPPYLDIDDKLRALLRGPFIGGYSTDDWRSEMTPSDICDAILKLAGDGRIILCHELDRTVIALRTAIPALLEQGYRFVTLSELFRLRGVDPASVEDQYYHEVNPD